MTLGAVAVLGLTSAASLVANLDAEPDVPTALEINPAVPPSGGFAVRADHMDETLLDLVAVKGTRRAWPAPGGEQVLVDDTGGSGRRTVQTGGILLPTSRGPALVQVDVRRPSVPCPRPVCVRVVRTAAVGGVPPSTLAVVVDAGVEVRAQAWAGPGRRAPATGVGPPLSACTLVDLAGDPVWRDRRS